MKIVFISLAAIILSTTLKALVIVDSGLTGSRQSGLIEGGKALGFTTGSQAYTLDSVEVRLVTGSTLPDSSLTTFALHRGGNSGPNNMAVLTFDDPTLSTSATANYSLGFSGPFTLEANTIYWFTVFSTDTNPDVFGFAFDSPGQDATVAGGVTITSNEGRFENAGVFDVVDDPSTWSGISSTYNAIRISGTAIPEPGTYGLLVGLLGLVHVMFRRRR